MEITLTRKDRPSWKFSWSDKYKGYLYETSKKGIYRVFFNNCNDKPKYDWATPDIWIGKLVIDSKGDKFWITKEKEIKADSLIFFRGQFNFK